MCLNVLGGDLHNWGILWGGLVISTYKAYKTIMKCRNGKTIMVYKWLGCEEYLYNNTNVETKYNLIKPTFWPHEENGHQGRWHSVHVCSRTWGRWVSRV